MPASTYGGQVTLKYRLVALDLDGTVINKDGAVFSGAREAITRILACGLRVTLATGRMYQPANRLAEELNMSEPLICHQGALIRETGNGRVLRYMPLPALMVRRVITELREEGIHRHGYIDGAICVERRREDDIRYAQHSGVELHLVDDLTAVAERQPSENASKGEAVDIDRLVARVRASCGAEVIVNKIHASFCKIAHAMAGKGNALKYVAERPGIQQ
jgi:HAD superfamily hydrolase (TIGR01484 family)